MEGDSAVTAAGRTRESLVTHGTIAPGSTSARSVSETDEPESRRRARRIALMLMGASSLFVLVILGTLWFVVRRLF